VNAVIGSAEIATYSHMQAPSDE